MLALVLSPLIAMLLTFAGYMLRHSHKPVHSESPYECGFIITEGQVWKPFIISFFMVGLLFLLFDLELLWVFPLTKSSLEASSLGSYFALLFFNFVVLSLAYEVLVETIKQIRMSTFALAPLILGVAFVTLADRKGIAAFQRRLGPETVGVIGFLQPFADALKLITKELIHPEFSLPLLTVWLPVVTLGSNLSGYSLLPLGGNSPILDTPLHALVTLGLLGLSVHGVLYVAWGAINSFSFIGGIRTVAQIVSYELTLSASVLLICLSLKSLNYGELHFLNEDLWGTIGSAPIVPLYLLAALAESARTPFDLPEAESEIVAGFITELSATPFILYFLAEYSSLVLLSILGAVLFGSNTPFSLEEAGLIFIAVWARAVLPRLRYSQLIWLGWQGILPLSTAAITLILTLRLEFVA